MAQDEEQVPSVRDARPILNFARSVRADRDGLEAVKVTLWREMRGRGRRPTAAVSLRLCVRLAASAAATASTAAAAVTAAAAAAAAVGAVTHSRQEQ